MNQQQRQDLDKQITTLYLGGIKNGTIKAFCSRTGLNPQQVRRRALDLGIIEPLRKEPDWSEEEMALLEKNQDYGPTTLRRILKRHGYTRSDSAIIGKKRRMELFKDRTDVYTATGLAAIMGIEPKVVFAWIKKGWLTATPRGPKRDEGQGADINDITRKAVREFIRDNVAVVDIRKADKFWLVDLLVGA